MFNIQPDCYILALFKRDDGERFLLGSGAYEFADKQQHFAPNTIANDVVELQGADGQLLAGQVVRSARQSFDGVIGDATMTRREIEDARRAFLNFFIVRHRYQVIYILPDGRSITRYRGYLVDAPSAQELWQFMPNYHVALAFEQLPYYSYAEDDDGNQIYANGQTLNESSWRVVDGGVEWDAAGAMWIGAAPASPNKFNVAIDYETTYGNIRSLKGTNGEYDVTVTAMTSSTPTAIFNTGECMTQGVSIYGNSGDSSGSHYTLTIFYEGYQSTDVGYPDRLVFTYLREEGGTFVDGGQFTTAQYLYQYTRENPYTVTWLGRQGATTTGVQGNFEVNLYSYRIRRNSSGTTPASGKLYIQLEEGDSATPWQPAGADGGGGGDTPDDNGLKWTDYQTEGELIINNVEASPMATTTNTLIKPAIKLSAGDYQNVVITNQTTGTSYAVGSISVTGDIEFTQDSLTLKAGNNEVVMTADSITGVVTLEWNDEVLA